MRLTIALAIVAGFGADAKDLFHRREQPSPLDRYIAEAQSRAVSGRPSTPGSLWVEFGTLSDLARDLRASRIDDVLTVVVAERAAAEAKGDTRSSRKSSAVSGVPALFGKRVGPFRDLAQLSTDTQLAGQGATSRESTLTATLAARVAAVLPNGNIIIEGSKDTVINSERQLVTVRGVARPEDVSPGNLIRSDRLAQLEVRINGRGVVADAVRRPNFLYRLLLGVLPF